MSPMTFSALPLPRPRWERALVTGGAGFLGSHLCERLLDGGIDVDCVDDLSTGSRDNVRHLTGRPGFRVLELDVTGPGLDALAGPYDLVLHFAGPAAPSDPEYRPLIALDTARLGTRNALTLAERSGARFLLGSACQVYGDPEEHPQSEEYCGHLDPVGPRSAHDEATRYAEALTTAYATAHCADAGIVRVFNTYGPRMRADGGRAVPTFVRQALAGQPLTIEGDGRQTRSFCYVDDVVDGVLRVAAGRSVRPVNIGGDEETTVLDLARRVLALTGARSTVRFGPARPHDPARRRPVTHYAREIFGWSPGVGLDDGLKRTIAHFAEQPPPPGRTEPLR
jgi:dTDP-glucose 4,6-dehydratase